MKIQSTATTAAAEGKDEDHSSNSIYTQTSASTVSLDPMEPRSIALSQESSSVVLSGKEEEQVDPLHKGSQSVLANRNRPISIRRSGSFSFFQNAGNWNAGQEAETTTNNKNDPLSWDCDSSADDFDEEIPIQINFCNGSLTYGVVEANNNNNSHRASSAKPFRSRRHSCCPSTSFTQPCIINKRVTRRPRLIRNESLVTRAKCETFTSMPNKEREPQQEQKSLTLAPKPRKKPIFCRRATLSF